MFKVIYVSLSFLLILSMAIGIMSCGEDEEDLPQKPVVGNTGTTPVTLDAGEDYGDAWRIEWVHIDKSSLENILAEMPIVDRDALQQKLTEEQGKLPDPDENNRIYTTDHIRTYNAFKEQGILAVKVSDRLGRPVPDARVEWTILNSPNMVGDVIETDDPGFQKAAPQIKVDNRFAITFTNKKDDSKKFEFPITVLPNEGVEQGEPIFINVGKKGETWVVITAARRGITDIAAYCPNIVAVDKDDGTRNNNSHKIFATKIWNCYDWEFPNSASNDCKQFKHPFETEIKQGIGDVSVQYTILNPEVAIDPLSLVITAAAGPPDKGDTSSKKTIKPDASGKADVSLNLPDPPPDPIPPPSGTPVRLLVEILLNDMDNICEGEELVAEYAIATKKWEVEELRLTPSPLEPLCLEKDANGMSIPVDIPVTVSLLNVGPPLAADVVAREIKLIIDYPEGITVAPGGEDGSIDDTDLRRITWEPPNIVETLAPGVDVSKSPTFAASSGGEYRFTATATSICNVDTATWTVNVEEFEVITPPNDFVCLTETSVNIPEPGPGNFFQVRNLGASSTVTLTIDYPDQEGITVANPDGGEDDGDKITYNIGALSQDATSRQFTPTFTASSGGTYDFEATASSVYCEAVPKTWTVTVENFEVTTPEEQVLCLEDAGNIPNTISVTNHGAPLVPTATLAVDYPDQEGITVVDSDGGVDDGDKITYDIGNLPEGSTFQRTPRFDASSGGGAYPFTATVTSKCEPPVSEDWTVTVIEVEVSCVVSYATGDWAELDFGEVFDDDDVKPSNDPKYVATYILTVTNKGNNNGGDTVNVTLGLVGLEDVNGETLVTDPNTGLSIGLKLVSGQSPETIQLGPNETITRIFGLKGTKELFEPEQTQANEFILPVTATVKNISSVTDSTVTCPPKSTSCDVTIQAIPSIEPVSFSDTADPIERRHLTRYRMVIWNQGTASAHDVKLECILPEQMDLITEITDLDPNLDPGDLYLDPNDAGKGLHPENVVVCKVELMHVNRETIEVTKPANFPPSVVWNWSFDQGDIDPLEIQGVPGVLKGRTGLGIDALKDSKNISFTFGELKPDWAFRISFYVQAKENAGPGYARFAVVLFYCCDINTGKGIEQSLGEPILTYIKD